jgi:hypothetical protein
MFTFLNNHTHSAGIAIHFKQLSIMEYACRLPGANHCRDAILTGNDRAVTQHTTLVGDDSRSSGK